VMDLRGPSSAILQQARALQVRCGLCHHSVGAMREVKVKAEMLWGSLTFLRNVTTSSYVFWPEGKPLR
jgi:hypothetical protein